MELEVRALGPASDLLVARARGSRNSGAGAIPVEVADVEVDRAAVDGVSG
ncbi:hypothetical protein OV203_50270 [Nannocystis sp. ILAH1]|nr:MULTISPECIES: hypothetical protein [unclassified Nannocystis]MCY0995412.1 hypothetical protein [Nannocystis sp. ILAH1]MCY1063897.1 hypothetical protein [Nannocystis sp. RBIL2]